MHSFWLLCAMAAGLAVRGGSAGGTVGQVPAAGREIHAAGERASGSFAPPANNRRGPGWAGATGAPGPAERQAGGVAQPRQAPRQLMAPAAKTKTRTKPQPAPAATAAIRKAMAAEAAAWNRGDIDGFMAAYWKSPETEFIGAGGVTKGWETVRQHYLTNYPDRAAMGTLTFTGLQVTLLGRNYAYVVGHFHLVRAHDHPEGVFTLLWRKFPEGWRIISDHTTETGH